MLIMTVKVFNGLTIFVLFLYLQKSIQQQKCTKSDLKKLDDTVAKIITIGDSSRKFPEDRQELKTFVDDSHKLIQDTDQLKTKCMTGLSKQTMSVIVFSFKNVISQFRKPESKRAKNVLQSFPCMNKGSSGLNECNSQLIDEFLGAKNADEKLRIPHMCCAYQRLISCGVGHLRKVKGCTDFHIDIGQNFLQSLFGDAINLLCTEYSDDTDKCEKLGAPPKKLKSQRKTKSFILPLIDVLSSFPEV